MIRVHTGVKERIIDWGAHRRGLLRLSACIALNFTSSGRAASGEDNT